ncbi:hypothetical protein ON010_g4503 [Phytophthora cinnamomi]|nr:hypothetical protein ON010_g4503 [Phytophthora cinnamomi]
MHVAVVSDRDDQQLVLTRPLVGLWGEHDGLDRAVEVEGLDLLALHVRPALQLRAPVDVERLVARPRGEQQPRRAPGHLEGPVSRVVTELAQRLDVPVVRLASRQPVQRVLGVHPRPHEVVCELPPWVKGQRQHRRTSGGGAELPARLPVVHADALVRAAADDDLGPRGVRADAQRVLAHVVPPDVLDGAVVLVAVDALHLVFADYDILEGGAGLELEDNRLPPALLLPTTQGHQILILCTQLARPICQYFELAVASVVCQGNKSAAVP